MKFSLSTSDTFLTFDYEQAVQIPQVMNFFYYLTTCRILTFDYESYFPILHYTINPDIFKQLIFTPDLWLVERWCLPLCKSGGVPKGDFVGLQIAAYEMYEAIKCGDLELELTINGVNYVPRFPDVIDRDGRDTKSQIKHIKKFRKDKPKTCGAHLKNPEPGNIHVCCVCNPHRLHICEVNRCIV